MGHSTNTGPGVSDWAAWKACSIIGTISQFWFMVTDNQYVTFAIDFDDLVFY